MKGRGISLIFFIFISFWGISQTKNVEFIEGEIYLKTTKVLSKNRTSNKINFNAELPFLADKFKKNSVLRIEKPFYTAESDNLQKIYRLKVADNQSINELIASLKSDPNIDYVEKVPMRYCFGIPNDPSVSNQWFLSKIKAFDAWDVNAGSQNINVAVVDNAVQTNHIDLANNMLAGYDLADNDADPTPPNATFNHGTHVAGIAGAVTNNSLGIASAANNRVKIIPVKATPDTGNPRGIYFGYEGVAWAADNGANIISLSWGGNGYTQTEQDVINYAVSRGCMIVAAAGNENSELEVYPGAYSNVIAVASLDDSDTKSSFSSFGTWVDISAPGRGILSTLPFDTYGSLNGTSMATPLVSACIGYLWSCFPSLTPSQIENLLKNTADKIENLNPNFQGKLGAGRVNLLKMISCPNNGINAATISANGSTYICKGESVVLSGNQGNNLSFLWFKNGISTSLTTQNLTITEEGSYQVLVNSGFCSLISEPKKVIFNTLISPQVSVSNKDFPYCSTISTGNGLQATAQNCNFSGPTTYTYTGGTVGYDAYESSGANPSVSVNNNGGLISSVSVSITWQKKDQENENSCDLADGGAVPFNEEVAFKLQSPSGKIITLIAHGTYNRGTTSSGIVTTVFQDGANPIPQNSLPTSGTFAPNQPLSAYFNEVPIGTWTLLPEDDGFVDPLCVSGFSITITTNSANGSPQVSWWNQKEGGNLLQNGVEYTNINTTTIGKQTFYIQSKCEGLCPSERVAVSAYIKPIPEVVIFPVSQITTSNASFSSLLSSQTLNYRKNKNGEFEIFDESGNNPVVISVGNVPPLTNPITLCQTNQSYLLMAIGCPTNIITWSYGQNGQNLIVSPTSTIGYSAYCHKDWSPCQPIISNIVHFITTDHHPYEIVDEIAPNNVQKFVNDKIIAKNLINTPAIIEYRGMKSVELRAGFQVNGNSVFKAEIRGCD